MNKAIYAIICIFLIISTPVTSFGYYNDPIDGDPRDLGEALTINVDHISPTPITSDLFQHRAANVQVFLSGKTLGTALFGSSQSPSGAQFYGDMKIKHIDLVPNREASKYIQGGLTSLVRPKGEELIVDTNGNIDLGYTKVRLKRQPVEDKVPDEITIDVEAKIYFDVESGFGVLSTQSFNLAPQENEEAWLQNDLGDSSLWGGRGYIRVIEINGNTARVQLYDGNKRKIGFTNQVKLTAGGESKEVTLPGAPTLLENRINLKLERISKNENKATLLVEEEYEDEILSSTKEYVAGMKLNNEWTVKEIFSYGLIIKDSEGNEIFISYEVNTPISNPCANFNYLSDDKLEDASAKQLYCQAIQDYKSALLLEQTKEQEAQHYIGIAKAYEGLNAVEHANTYLTNAIIADPSLEEKYQDRIENSQSRLQNKYSYTKVDNMLVTLMKINDNARQSTIKYALLNNYGDSITGLEYNNATVGSYVSTDIIDEQGNKYRWIISAISSNEVIIKQDFLNINSRNRPEEKTRTLEISKKTQVPFGSQSKFIYVDKIEIAESAIITVSPGTRDNYGTSYFTIHLPIEKRLWQWTPEEIDKMIASTDNTLNKLDGIIGNLGSIISTWKGVCYATFAALTVKNAFFSNPAKRLIENKVRTDCAEQFGENTEASVNCFNERKQEIEQKVETSKQTKDELDNIFKDADFEDEQSLQGIADRLNMDVNNLTLLHKYGELSGQDLYESMYNEEVWQDGSLNFDKQLKTVNNVDKSVKEEVGDRKLPDKEIKEIELKWKTNVGSGSSTTTTNAFFLNQNEHAEQVLQGKEIISRPDKKPFPIYSNGDEKYIIDTNGNKIIVTPKMDGSEILSSASGDFYEADGKIYLAGLSDGAFLPNYSTVPRIYFDKDTKTPILIPFQYDKIRDEFGFANYIHVDEEAERRGGYRFSIWNVGSDGIPNTWDDKIITHSDELDPNTRRDELDKLAYEVERTYQQAVPLAGKNKGSIIKFNRIDVILEEYEGEVGSAINANGQCEDSMSKTDCKILYNVCDPVMCPPSRFDLGGKWNLGGDAGSVVQKGIIGSITLGWGNGDILPICLTGIHAGLENIYSMFGGFRDCLEVAKTSGESVGICNEIRSLYMCNILWEEALALVNVFGKLQSFISTSIFGSSSGGEYKLWESSWSKLGDSVNFFTKSYATSAFAAFTSRSSDEIGSTICKQAIFGRTPAGGDLLGQLTSPESPPQFTGWFEEDRSPEVNLQSGFINTQSQTGTGQSTYRIFYHIYAGRNKDIRYKVILKNINGQTITVNDPGLFQGERILRRGESVDQSFTLPNLPPGFIEMCIIIDGVQECGFGSTSSGFSTQYLKDEMIKSDLNKKIDTEEECSPRERSYVPGLFTSGVKRVCAAYDPDGAAGDEWEFVGTCGQDELGRSLGNCYVYAEGIKDSIHDNSYDVSAAILELQKNQSYTKEQEQQYRDEIQKTLNNKAQEEYEKLISESNSIQKKDNNKRIQFINELHSLITRTIDDDIKINSYNLAATNLIILAKNKKLQEIQKTMDKKLEDCAIKYDGDHISNKADEALFKFIDGAWTIKPLNFFEYNQNEDPHEFPFSTTNYVDGAFRIDKSFDCTFFKNRYSSYDGEVFTQLCKNLVNKNFDDGARIITDQANSESDDYISVIKNQEETKFNNGDASYFEIINICGGKERIQQKLQQTGQQDIIEIFDKKIDIQIKYSNKDDLNLIYKDGKLSVEDQGSYLVDKYGLINEVTDYITTTTEEITIEHEDKEYNLFTPIGNNIDLTNWIENAIFQNVIDNNYPFELKLNIPRDGFFDVLGGKDYTLVWNGFAMEKIKIERANDDYSLSGAKFEELIEQTIFEINEKNPDKLELTCDNGQKTSLNDLSDQVKIVEWIEEKSEACGADKIDKIIEEMAEKYKIDSEFIKAIIKHESNFDSNAISSTGCSGLMQVCGSSAPKEIINIQCKQNKNQGPQKCDTQSCSVDDGYNWCDVCSSNEDNCLEDNRFNSRKNIEAGTKVLNEKISSIGDCGDDKIKAWAAAYNLGELFVNDAIKRAGNCNSWEKVWGELYKNSDFSTFTYTTKDGTEHRRNWLTKEKINGLKGESNDYVGKIYDSYQGYLLSN
ncbi:transglycosylase SLT domain-containing protein [Candidatus Woesearchaeota archaeon]|nr:transglycosylase SLT domain-containing protein [Candidatus Woesearchaeota archaeon]MBT7238171.1 transglycosylase SLT domain-containing protein [Candidatus Woesearchaeota archaeon]